MYFQNIPKLAYLLNPADAQAEDNFVVLTDITKNVRFKQQIIDNIVLYDYYHLQDGETMEHVSEKFYGSPQYHWVLMLLNDRYDWRSDMPLNTAVFEEYVATKYGSVSAAKAIIAFYKNSEGLAVDSTHLDYMGQLDATPVTAYEVEVLLNEEKRKIKILSRQVMDTVLKNYKDLSNG